MADAIKGFNNNKYHDLFLFFLTDTDIATISKPFNKKRIYSARTYFFAVNARSISNMQQREKIFNLINKSEFIQSCYHSNEFASGIIPPGFVGHIPIENTTSDQKPIKSQATIERLHIFIAKGVSSEKCVEKYFKKSFGHIKKLSVIVEDVSKLSPLWINKKIDAFFAYVEAYTNLNVDIFQFFNPSSHFSLGLSKDPTFHTHMNDILAVNDYVQKHTKAQQLTRHINEIKTILPIYHPMIYLLYHHRYKSLAGIIRSPMSITFNYFNLKK